MVAGNVAEEGLDLQQHQQKEQQQQQRETGLKIKARGKKSRDSAFN